MDIKQLKFLIALDETRHFGQAAARCHITQPTLSMRLRSLEQELDLQLVNRGQRFESFTAPGERVLAWARTVLAAYDGLQAEAAAWRGNLIGTLRLGVVPLSSFDPLPLLQRLHQEHPELRFELSALSSEQILEQLASNQLDVGVSYLDRLDHALDVQRAVVPGDFLVEMRGTNRIVVDHIAITPGDCLEARMEVRRHHLGPTDTDVVGQIDIGAHDPRLQRALGLSIKVHHLPAGMHPGIGTPGTHQRHRRVGDF